MRRAFPDTRKDCMNDDKRSGAVPTKTMLGDGKRIITATKQRADKKHRAVFFPLCCYYHIAGFG